MLSLLPAARAEDAAFDGSRNALTLPDEVWERVLADGGRAGRAIGYTADELKAFGKDAHLLRGVQALFANVRKIPRESGRITSGLLENAAKPSEVIARAYGLCDVSAGRMYEPPKNKRWGLPKIDAIEAPAEALQQFLKDPPSGLDAYPPAVLRLVTRLCVGSELAMAWLAVVHRGAPMVAFPSGPGFSPDAPRTRAHDFCVAPWVDEEHGQTATFGTDTLARLGIFDRARMAYASQIFAVHLERAIDEWRAAPETDKALGDAAFPLLLDARGTWGVHGGWGQIAVYGPGRDEATLPEGTLLSIDLGGDDAWRGCIGAGWEQGTRIGLHLDLGGSDTYRAEGPASLASGLGGIGVVVDLAGDDAYVGVASNLGCGWFGTGLLLDVAGNDHYRSTKPWGQGAGHMGVGALVDLAGDDDYECTEQSQGLGGTLGTGLLIDLVGNDSYVARDDGNVSELYLGQSVAMSQGCGYGRRADIGDGLSLAGGVGILVDGAGDDRYHAQVWAQGCGYWWGLGILEDRGGDDAYQNGKYSAGAAAHFALGVCIDLAGHDMHNATNVGAKNQFQGHARDGSIGVFIDGDGDDGYDVNNNCAGSADLNSIALFWDRRGEDRYTFHPTDVEGEPNGWNDTGAFGTSTRYPPFFSFRDDLPSWGIFLDTGGRDTYANERPAKGWVPTPAADGATWKPQSGPLVFGLGYDLGSPAR
jgi:hypothetical protein